MPVRLRVAVLLLVGLALALPSYAAGVAPEKAKEREIAGLLEASWSNLVRIFERAMAKIDPPDAPANEPPPGNGDRGATLDPWG